jgi:hypothetical protein
MRWALICLVLCASVACPDRSLDLGPAGSAPYDDGGLRPDGALDFAISQTIDLASSLPGVDLAQPSVDLASSATVGVPCGTQVCNAQQMCCPGSGVAAWSCKPTGPGAGGSCGMGFGGLRCDGPEDCTMGRKCVASLGNGQPQTRCRMTPDNGDFVVCHSAQDCPQPGSMCTPAPVVVPGQPAVSICVIPV